MRSREFRRVYDKGVRIPGPLFVAFCLGPDGAEPRAAGPRIGFTVPRAIGGAVVRNRIRRRLREALRVRLADLDGGWQIVVNPRKQAFDAPFADIEKEVEKLLRRLRSQG